MQETAVTEERRKILSSVENGVGRLIFNNPQRRNAMSLEMWETTSRTLESFDQNPEVRVIVLSGAGGKAFVSGADISKFESERSSVEQTLHYNEVTADTSRVLQGSSKPTIGMIQGFCMGGGLAISLCCDMRYCTPESVFGLPAAKLGVGYGFEGIRRLLEITSPSYAREICFTGRRYTAEEALHMQLVNRIVPDSEIEGFVHETATTIAENAPLTVGSLKQIFIELAKNSTQRDPDRCKPYIEKCFTSQDYIEGRKAFLEKRKAQFKGQ